MVLSWFGGSKDESLADLIGKKKYRKAIELLRTQFSQGSRDPRMRIQLADVLVMAGRGQEAVPILIGLADEYAFEGFAAKAIAVLKKIDRIQPGRTDVERKLASLIEQQRRAAPAGPSPPASASRGAPEFGMEEIPDEPPAAPAAGPGLEPEKPERAAARQGTAELLASVLVPDEEPSEEAFGAAVLGLAQGVAHVPHQEAATGGGLMATPLFKDLGSDELVALIHGLQLITFDPGDIMITEGEPGDSLFILSTGRAKAFVRNPAGRHVQVREMDEGSFFGEISVLNGVPRSATVTASTPCELLELDQDTLQAICRTYPRVRTVLEEFAARRAGSAEENVIRSMAFGSRRPD